METKIKKYKNYKRECYEEIRRSCLLGIIGFILLVIANVAIFAIYKQLTSSYDELKSLAIYIMTIYILQIASFVLWFDYVRDRVKTTISKYSSRILRLENESII